jgi:hypothetical protein
MKKNKAKLKLERIQKAASGLYDVAVPEAGNTGNVLSSGLGMASTGMEIAGPWGAAAGAVIGLTTGLLQKKKQDKLNKEALIKNRNMKNARSMDGVEETINQTEQVYKDGSMKIKKSKVIEVEGGEHHFDEDLNHKGVYTGKSHKEGGIVTTVEEGDSIIPKKHKTKVTKALKAGDLKAIDKIRKDLPRDKDRADDGLYNVDKKTYNTRNKKLRVASFNKTPLYADDANRKGRYGDYQGAVAGLETGANKWLGQGEKGNPYPYGVISVPNPTAKNGFTMYRHDDMPQIKPVSSIPASGIQAQSLPSTLPSVPVSGGITSDSVDGEAPIGSPKKKAGDFLKYANVANNLIRGLQSPAAPDESYLNPDLLEYKDRSETVRQASRMGEAVNSSNARNTAGGNVGNMRANQASGVVDNITRQEAINETEMQRADAIDNANVQIKNRAKEVNLGRKDMYEEQMKEASGAKENYMNTAIKGVSDFAQTNERMNNRREFDDKTIGYLNQLTKFQVDPTTGKVKFNPNGIGGNSQLPVTTTTVKEDAKGGVSKSTTTKTGQTVGNRIRTKLGFKTR